MNIPVICIGILGLLTIGLGLGVSLNRRSSKRSVGVPDDPPTGLLKYSRAHGNTVEYAPLLALMIWIRAETGVSGWVHWVMIGATLS
ncbi:MAG: MAPEG family protein, partial [Pseudomonadota bacterium]